MFEGRAPNSSIAASPITQASLLKYSAANADLQEAFDISENAVSLTAAQELLLISHFYRYGYAEDRTAPPTNVLVQSSDEIILAGVSPETPDAF